MPMTPLTGDLGKADLQVLERYADPRALLAAGPAELTALISSASRGHQGQARAAQWTGAARAAIELYGPDDPAVPFADLAAEVATEIRLLKAIETGLQVHAAAREAAYCKADPGQIARTLPGLAEVGGPGESAGRVEVDEAARVVAAVVRDFRLCSGVREGVHRWRENWQEVMHRG
jgi:hypothetical protein